MSLPPFIKNLAIGTVPTSPNPLASQSGGPLTFDRRPQKDMRKVSAEEYNFGLGKYIFEGNSDQIFPIIIADCTSLRTFVCFRT